jgi:ubiquinone/menaquinone biosynthesis C-methylase UbiE
MPRSPEDWHRRFQQQAGWTEQLRRHMFTRLKLQPQARILEVGCGTGAITSSLSGYANIRTYGLDINLTFLRLAARQDPRTRYCGGNALHLPFPDGVYDAVVCHFFLLWIPQAQAALAEMVRAARPGGAVIAFAEPDYGGRIDYPPPLEPLGRLQAEALRQQGANPNQGRALAALFQRAGLRQVETGLLGGQWRGTPSAQEQESEWATLESDLAGMLPVEKLEELRRIDAQAWAGGERVLFVPTFYASGIKAQI